VTFLYDVRTGAVRREVANWAKGDRKRGDYEVPAILDQMHVGDDVVTVLDLKSGKRLGAAGSNGQLIIGAICAAKFYRKPRVRVGLVYPGVRKMRGVDEAEFDALDLAEQESRIQSLAAKIGSTEPNPGSWCWRCPAKAACPAMRPTDAALDW
jgi:hypothetical protein